MTAPGPPNGYFVNPLNTPDELRQFAKDALLLSRSFNVLPPAQTVGSVVTSIFPDQRISSIAAALQGMLAMQLADSITHVIPEEP